MYTKYRHQRNNARKAGAGFPWTIWQLPGNRCHLIVRPPYSWWCLNWLHTTLHPVLCLYMQGLIFGGTPIPRLAKSVIFSTSSCQSNLVLYIYSAHCLFPLLRSRCSYLMFHFLFNSVFFHCTVLFCIQYASKSDKQTLVQPIGSVASETQGVP